MAPKARFADGEKVLCFHGPLLYEAKCLGSQIRDKHMKYFIHYNGWNKNWDEWVPECRVLKYNEANLQKQKELEKTHMKTKKPKGSKSSVKKDVEKEKEPTPPVLEKPKQTKQEKRPASAISEPSSSPIELKKPKIKTEPVFADEVEVDLKQSICPTPQQNELVDDSDLSNQEIKEEPMMEAEIKFDIPPALRCWLVDDCDLINHQKKILHLPARVTVDHIIASYVKEKVSVKGLSANMEITIVQIANRIRDCFNVLLGKSLLYKFERPQYKEMLSEHLGLRMCEIYGAIHLLRMFTTLGDMLQSIKESGKVMSTLVGHIEDFIKYMAANPSFFSLDDYEVASPEYHRRALT